jgi:hypothetical protein
MSGERNQPHLGQGSFQSNTPDVWAEIQYLDSETDYRECLPVPYSSTTNPSELIMTDDASNSIWNTMVAVVLVLSVAFAFVVLLIRIFSI